MCTASPPGPVLRSCAVAFPAPGWSLSWMSHMTPTETILPSPAVTSRPPGARLCDMLSRLVRYRESHYAFLVMLVVTAAEAETRFVPTQRPAPGCLLGRPLAGQVQLACS